MDKNISGIVNEIRKLIPLSSKNIEILEDCPVKDFIGQLFALYHSLNKNNKKANADIIKRRIIKTVFEIIDTNSLENIANYDQNEEVQNAIDKARELGWSDDELINVSDNYYNMSLVQLMPPDAKIIEITEDKITIETALGNRQNVWRHAKYK